MKYRFIDDGYQFRLSPEGMITNARDVRRFPKSSFPTKEAVVEYSTNKLNINIEDITNL